MNASRTCTVCNRRGLHARASAKLAAAARGFDATVTLSREGETVSAASIMDLLMLAAGPGSEVTIAAEGADAQAAVDAICALIECGFEETD